MKIYEFGYSTERRFLAYCLIKMFLLTLNWLVFVVLIKLTVNSIWKTLYVIVLPSVIFALIFKMDYGGTPPLFHYLSENQTYQLAKFYIIDKSITDAHCSLDHQWCLNKFLHKNTPPMTPIR